MRLNTSSPLVFSLFVLSLSVLSGCPGSTGSGVTPDAGGNTFQVGEDVDEFACEGDLDCPFGYRCELGNCTIIDNDLDNDGYDAAVDCDDNDPDRNPGEPEACNDIDDNCDGQVDEGVRNQCGECGPVPVEICDLLDNDCDGAVDEGCVGGQVAEVEPNGGQANCQDIVLPPTLDDEIVVVGAYTPAGDIDSYCFHAPAGTVLEFDIDSAILGAPTDGVLSLFGSDGEALPGGYNDYSDGSDPFLSYSFDEPTTVRLDTYHFYADDGGPEYTYELHIRALELLICEDGDGDGLTPCDGDCNDADNQVFPGQTETCDGYDNNCDGEVDEECPELIKSEAEPNDDMSNCPLLTLPFTVDGVIDPKKDKDVYCFFVPGNAEIEFDIDAQEPPYDSLLNSRLKLLETPGDVITTNNDGIDPETSYFEEDSDSYLSFTFARPGIYAIEVSDESTLAGGSRLTYVLKAKALFYPVCEDNDLDGVSTCEGDCEDDDPEVHFGRAETCDNKDNNCDGVSDPGTCIGDFDGDGYGGLDGDCDDNDPTRNPAANEICDGFDNDCDGDVDEGVKNSCGGCGYPPVELCGDNIDNDCDDVVDTDCDTDLDTDGVTPNDGDCDDSRDDVYPGAPEVCDGVDNNCDGFVDEYVKNSCGACAPEPEEICDGLDNNCNGLVDDGALNACGECGPTGPEICDGADNDCNGEVDDGVSNACGLCGPLPLEACDRVDNDCNDIVDDMCDDDGDSDLQTPAQGDCNDADGTVYAGAPEVCGDGKDNNCNGYVDDGCPAVAETEVNQPQAACELVAWPGERGGVIQAAADHDWYCVEVTVPGTQLAFDIDARDDGSPLDSLLTLYNESGVQLVTNNNNIDPQTGLSTTDSYILYTFDNPGVYAVRVAAFATGESAGPTSTYELEVRAEGGCLDLDGDKVTSCDGDCDDTDSTVRPGAREVCGDGISQNCSDTPDDECVGLCLDDLTEPNDTPAGAYPVAPGSYPELQLCGGDPDLFTVSVGAGETLRADVLFSHAVGNLDVDILDPGGSVVQSGTSTNDNEVVQHVAGSAGDYFIRVQGASLADEAPYELIVTITN